MLENGIKKIGNKKSNLSEKIAKGLKKDLRKLSASKKVVKETVNKEEKKKVTKRNRKSSSTSEREIVNHVQVESNS